MEMLELKPKQTKTIKKKSNTDEIFFQWAHKEV